MSAEIVVSVISAGVALTSVYLSAKAAQRTARLTHQLDLEAKRATKEEQVEELMSRYREPLLRAAFDLQSRIWNIIRQGFFVRYGVQGKDHEREYARESTLFLFAQYFSWVEILRRQVQFLDLGDVARNRLFVDRLERIADVFASDRQVEDAGFRLFRGEQRALGEVMTAPADDDGPGLQCMGYAEFHARLHGDPSFARWFEPLGEHVSTLAHDDAPCYERLTQLQHALINLIAFLDDPPRRFLPEHLTKL